MATYHYKALSADGQLIAASAESTSRDALFDELRRAGHFPIDASETPERAPWFRELWPSQLRRSRVKPAAVTLLTSELATLLGAGMPVDTSLKMLDRVIENEALRGAVKQLLQEVQQGRALAQAFANQPAVFSSFFVAVVRAGEATGDMAAALRRLTKSLEARDELRGSVAASLTYPLLLAAVALLSVVFLLLVVIPQFVPLFADVGAALPLPTRVLFWASGVLRGYLWVLVPLGFVLGAAAWTALRRPEHRRRIAKAALRLPIVRGLVESFETAQFTRTAETLLGSGVPLLGAMRLAAGVVSNPVMREELTACVDGLRGGASLKRLLDETRTVPRLAVELISVGEQTGRLPEMLGRAADIYDARVRADLKRLLTLLEPALILGLGGVVGGIIAAILTALLSLTNLVGV